CCLLIELQAILSNIQLNVENNAPACSSFSAIQNACDKDLSVDRLVLINAQTQQDIMLLENGSRIPLAEFGSTPLSIRAESDNPLVKSVTLRLTGPKTHFQRENIEPYSLFGDKGPEEYQGELLPSGNYVIYAQAFSEKMAQGNAGSLVQIKFTVAAENPQITRLVLTEPKQARISTYPPITLRDGISIDIDEISFGTGFFNFTVLADTDPSQIGTVHYQLEGPVNHEQTENQVPYTLFGDFIDIWLLGGEIEQEVLNYKARRLLRGNYTLRVTPYPLPNRQGIAGETKIIRFRAFDSARDTEVSIQVSPNPTSEEIHIDSPEGGVLHIYNGQGEMIFQKEYSQPFSQDIALHHQPKGIYLIRLSNTEGVQEQKLILK
ncbi:MAG: T9SS type A sorting domain-containing protein, partial [Bacteroidota bacterium]